jgi:hypothetical protein
MNFRTSFIAISNDFSESVRAKFVVYWIRRITAEFDVVRVAVEVPTDVKNCQVFAVDRPQHSIDNW